MALPAVNGNTIQASDLYQLCQPSGGQEKSKYFIAGNAYASGALVSDYVNSQSRGATPVSVSIDTADGNSGTANAPTAVNLTANGFQAKTTSNAISLNVSVAGNYTIQF